MRPREVALLFLILVVGGALWAGDRFLPSADPSQTRGQGGPFLSNGWYCPIPGVGKISASISTANVGDESVRLRRWAVAEGESSDFLEGDLAPRRRASTAAADFGLEAPVVVAEAFGAATVTDYEVLVQGVGTARGICPVQPSDKWFFSYASTARGRDTNLLIANPFEEEARVTLRLMTPDETAQPASLDNLNVPRLSTLSVFLGDFFTETESLGVEVVATRGRVVATREVRLTARDEPRGYALSPGLNQASSQWYFAGGLVPEEGEDQIVLMNPNDEEILVEIIVLTETETLLQPALKEVAIPAGRQLTVVMSEHFPRGTRYGATLRSIHEQEFVAERVAIGTVDGVSGFDAIPGLRMTSSRWVVTVGSTAGGSDSLSLINAGTSRDRVSVSILNDADEVAPPSLTSVPLAPSRRANLDLAGLIGGPATVVVSSVNGSLVVEAHRIVGDPFDDFADVPAWPL